MGERIDGEIQLGRSPLPASALISESVPNNAIQRWISAREFSIRYAVSAPTVRRWIKLGRLTAFRRPPGPRGRVYVLEPNWMIIDPGTATDPAEWLCVLRQADVARLLGVTTRALRYMEAAGKAQYRVVGGRKLYSVSQVRLLLAQRQQGRSKVTRKERREALLRWAKSKLSSPSSVA
jgi:DNA-binding transcriptional MerR regulator